MIDSQPRWNITKKYRSLGSMKEMLNYIFQESIEYVTDFTSPMNKYIYIYILYGINSNKLFRLQYTYCIERLQFTYCILLSLINNEIKLGWPKKLLINGKLEF